MSYFKGKKVLVTGGSGFIGSHFVRRLLSEGAQVVVPIHKRQPVAWNKADVEILHADLTDQEACRKVMSGAEVVIHAAGAVSAAGITTGANPMSAITSNLVLTSQVIEACWAVKPDRLLIFGSSTGYPATDHPVREEEMWTAEPHSTYFGYGWMRRYLEKMAEFLALRGGVKVALVRPTATYGPFDDFDPATSHVIPALIRRAVAKEMPYEVWGTGDEIRDFLYVEDLIRGCLLALEKYADCDPINIGYGSSTTIKEVVEIVLKAAGHSCSPVFRSDRPSTIPKRMVDCSKAEEKIEFVQKVSLEYGIKTTVDWFISQQNTQKLCQ